MWKAIAHLLSSDLLSGTLCNAELLITPLNALGFGGVNDSAIVDYEMVKTALTIRGQKEYNRAYRDLNMKKEKGELLFLTARLFTNTLLSSSLLLSPRVVLFQCWVGTKQFLSLKRLWYGRH